MAFNMFGKNSGNKDSLPSTNPQQSTSSILGATGFAFKSNSQGLKSFSTEKILHHTKPLKLPIDEGSDSSEDEDDETTGTDSSDDSDTRVEQVKPKSNVLIKKNKLVNNVNDIQDDKASSIINKKPHATNIISDFSNFEFHSKLRALGGRAGNENYSQSEISFRNKKSNSNNLNTAKSDFVSGPTANPRIKVNNMMSAEEQSYNRSDIRSDVSWGSDPGQQQQQQQPPPQVKNPTVKVNPNFIIESQNFTPKLPSYINNNAPSYHHTNTNEWNTKSFDSRSEIMYRGKDKMVSSRYNNSIARNPRLNSSLSPGTPKTMSDVTYQPKELRTEVPNYDNPVYSSYGGNFNQRKPTVQLSARIPYSIDENAPFHSGARVINQQQQQQQQHKPKVFVEPQRKVASFAQLNKEYEENDDSPEQNEEEKDEEIDEEPDEEIEELMNMTDDESIQRKLLELHLSNKELLTLNKSLEENINEQSSELENFSSFDSLLKTQKEQLEHITNLENIIKDLTTKLSEQETQIKMIKGDEENRKSNATLFYDPRNLPLHTLPRIIFDRVYDDLNILYLVIKSLLYTFYIFPVLIFFRVTKKVYQKSKTKFIEITTE